MTDTQQAPTGVEFLAVRPVLDIYYRALSGRRAHLLPQHDDSDPAQYADSPTTIRLPQRVTSFATRRSNFDWYKVALSHRSAHYEHGTFDFSLTDATVFSPSLLAPLHDAPRMEPETDLERVFRSFTYRSLFIDVFTVTEDLRLDAALPRRLPGLAAALQRVQEAELQARPDPATLPPRTALLELLVRASLGEAVPPPLPPLLHEPVRLLAATVAPLRASSASVADAVEAAIRVYALITRLPALAADYGAAVPVPEQPLDAADVAGFDWAIRLPEPDAVRLEGGAILEVEVAPVGYRDLIGTRYGRYGVPGPPGQEAIFRLRPSQDGEADGLESDHHLHDDHHHDDDDDEDKVHDSVGGPPEPLEHEEHEWYHDDYAEAAGELDVRAPGEHVYPEWDHVRERYRPRWCRVLERTLPPGDSTRFSDETLQAYGQLLPGMVRQLERFALEGLRVVGRQPDGDDVDLDAGIEALIDLRAGLAASDNVHLRMERVARDVAVVFLIDLSSSTAERVPEPEGDGSAFGRRFDRIHGRGYRRIIDVEKESVALLTAALRRTGDAFGVYGFSGSGRAEVRFDVVKDLGEPMSRRVLTRIDGLKPIHTTRMGPAIRHATARLRSWPASTKLLMIVSDGRPFDLDYGQEYGEGAEIAYAMHDTRRALEEADEHAVRSVLLTVDAEGQDYLADLLGDREYETVADVRELPLRLLRLYRKVTR